MFEPRVIETRRGNYEIFKSGQSTPLVLTHLESHIV